MFRLGLYCYAADVSVIGFLSLRNSSQLFLSCCLQGISRYVTLFFFF